MAPEIEKNIGLKGQRQACRAEGCKEEALTLADYCWLHLQDKDAYKARLLDTLNKAKSAHKFNLKKVVLEGLELKNIDFSEANLTQSTLKDANLFYNNFSKADLMGSDLAGSDFTGSDLRKADLTRCNLARTRLWHTDASEAILTEANLTGADLWQCKLYNVRMWRTELAGAKFLTRQNFSQKNKLATREKLDETTHMSGEEAYRDLKKYFMIHGQYNDASWASFKEKTMEQVRLRKERNFAYVPVALMGLLCGYGEKPHRVISSSLFLIFIYGLLFYVLRGIRAPLDTGYVMNFWDYIYYSVVTFTTLGYGDIIPKLSPAYRMLAVSEAFIGAFMMGLFVFTLARKYSAR